MLHDDKIGNIATVLPVGELSEKQAGDVVWAVDDA